MTSALKSANPDEKPAPKVESANAATNGAPPRPDPHQEALAALPARDLPVATAPWIRHGQQPADSQPLVLMHQLALLQIIAHSRSNLSCELGGALLGQAYRHKRGVVVEVKAVLPAASSDHGPVHFTFSADSWSKLHHDRATHYPNLDIVGWFHTHPDLGVFYSSDDVVVHSAAFTLPWHVGLVVDPVREEAAFFGWIDGELAPLAGFTELPERQTEPVTPWRVVLTRVWDHTYEAELAVSEPSRVVLARSGRPRFSARELSLAASGLALLLSFFLIVGAVLPLLRQVNLLETTLLNLAQVSLAESNGLTCPDPRLRVIAPLSGQTYPAGSAIQIIGTADYPNARRYQLDVRPRDTEQWTVVNRLRRNTRLGELAEWNTGDLPAGAYELRLSPVDLNNIRLAGSSPCTVAVNLITPVTP
jgi:proteasome lid subunit RPN8/RPN11